MDRSQRRPPDVEEALSSMLWTPYERTPSDSSSDEDEKLNSKLKKSKTTFDYDNFHPNQYVPSSRKIQNYDNFTRFSYPYYGPIPTVQKCFTELPTYESLYHNITPVFSSISSLNGRLVHSFTDNFIAQPNEPRQSVPEATTAALLEIANSVSGFASNDATMSIVDPMHHHPHNPHNPQNLPNPHECSALMSSSVVGPVSSLTAQLHGERNSFGIHKSLGQTDNAGDPLSSMHHDTNNNRNGANDSIGDDDDDDDEPDECDDEDEGYSDPDRVDEDTQPDQSQKKRPQTSVINNNDQIDLAREETRVTKLRFQVEKPPHTTSHGVSFECSRFTNSGSALTQPHTRRQFDERGTSQKYCARSAQTDLNLIGVSVTTTTTANTTGETETRISSMRVVDGVGSLFIRAQNEPQLSFLNRGIRSNVAGKQDGPSSYGGGNGNGNGNENENINRSKGFGTFVVNVRNTLLAMRLNVPAAVAGKDPTNSNIPTTATTTTSVFLPISETLVNGQTTLSTSSPELMASLLPSSNPSTRTILGAILPPQPSLTIHVNQNENNSDLIKDVNDFSVNVNNSILQHSKWHDQQKSVVTPTTGISVVNCYSSVPNVNSINSVNNNNNYNNINNNYNNNNNISNVITRTTATATVSTQATASGTIATTTTNATNTANVANVVNEGSANVVNNNLNNNNLTNVNNATIQTPSSSSSSSSSFLSPSSSGATNQNGNVAKTPVTRTFTSTESQTDDLHIDVITNSINNNNLSDIPTSPVGASSNNDPGNSPGSRNPEIILNQTLSPGLIQSQTEALLSREQRRRERRERRHARNRHPHIMPPPVPPPQVMRPMLPDILHSHFPPPYTALSLTNPPPPASSLITPVISTVPIATAVNDGRFTFPLPVIRRSPSERSGKGCCGQWFAGPPLRALIAVVALGGVACALGGAALGATGLGGPPTSHLTAALLMIGVGVILVTVSGAAWRMTAPGGPPCLGLGSTVDLGRCGRRPCSSRGAPHGLLYPEFQHRPPPPSYQASMQEYRLRLLLLDRDRQNGVVRGGSPPPTYRSHAGSLLRAPLSTTNRGGNSSSIGGPGSEYSLPPSYRSRNTLTNNSSHSNENTNNRNTNNTNSSRSQNVSGDEALESQENSNNETTLLSKVEATILAQRSSTHATNITSPSASTTIGQSSSTPVKMTTSNSTAIKIKTDNSSYNNTSGSNVNSNNSSSAKNNNNNSSGYCKNGGNRRPTAGAILHHNPESQSQNYNEKFNPRVITNSNYHNNNSISNSVSCNNNSSTSSLSSTNHMNNNYNNNNNKIQNVTNSDTFVIEESENLQCSSLNKNATNIMNNNNCNFSNNTSNRKELVTIVTISSSQGPEQSQSEMEILAHL